MNKGHLNILLAGVGMAALALPVAAQAQAADDGRGIEEIVVTAERRETNIQTTPVSVTALSPKMLLSANVRDTRDLVAITPSLSIRPSGGGSPVSLTTALRGQFTNGINITNDPAVALYLDDIYIGKDAGNISDIVDVQQIEVLKGPQGTLFGRNSTGGAIRYSSARPDTSKFSGSLRGQYGNYNALLIQGVLNVPVSQTFAIRYAGSYQQHDGYTTTTYVTSPSAGVFTPVRTAKTDDLASQLHRLSVQWEPTSDFTLHAVASYHNREINGYLTRYVQGDRNITRSLTTPVDSPASQADFYAGELAANDPWGNPLSPFTFTKGWLLVGDIAYNISDATKLKLITGYATNHTVNRDFNVVGLATPFTVASTDQDFKQLSTELQLSGSALSDKLDYIAGLYYFRERGADDTDSTSFVASRVHSMNQGVGINKSYSAFLHGKYKIGDATTFQAGARYTIDNKSLVVSSRANTADITTRLPFTQLPCSYAAGTANVDSVNCTFSPSAKFKYWSYLVGLDHKFGDSVFVYAKTSRTSKSGGHQIRANNGDVRPFDPDTVTDYEVGVKLDLNRQVRLNVAAFYGFYKKFQFTGTARVPATAAERAAGCVASNTCTGPATTVVTNLSDAHIPGFEAELQTKFGPFGLSSGISYVNVDFVDPDLQQIYTPHWTYNVAATYEQDVGPGTLNARLAWNGNSSVTKVLKRSDQANVATLGRFPNVPPAGVFNGRIGMSFHNGMDVGFYCNNIGNRKYYLDAFASYPLYQDFHGFNPRTYGAEVGYKF